MAQGGAARFHPPWQARRERADRIVQRAATRRVSERHRVCVARACSSDTDSLAGRLQSPPAARLTWPSDPKRVREPRSDQPAFAAPGSTLELSQNGGTLRTPPDQKDQVSTKPGQLQPRALPMMGCGLVDSSPA